MPDRRAQFIILCEDIQQRVFVRRFLKVLGIHDRKVRVLPHGLGGSAEQYVRQSYPDQLEAFRTAAASTQTVLIVVVDCDLHEVAERRRQFDDECRTRNVKPRGKEESVALLLPKRNIETWIHFLMDWISNDESISYEKFTRCEAKCHPAVDELHRVREAGWSLPANAPPSLVASVPEWQRFC